MALHAEWTDDELPELIQVLNRALNTWDPKDAPKWAWKLEAAAVARLNDIKASREIGLIKEGGRVIDDPTARMHG